MAAAAVGDVDVMKLPMAHAVVEGALEVRTADSDAAPGDKAAEDLQEQKRSL